MDIDSGWKASHPGPSPSLQRSTCKVPLDLLRAQQPVCCTRRFLISEVPLQERADARRCFPNAPERQLSPQPPPISPDQQGRNLPNTATAGGCYNWQAPCVPSPQKYSAPSPAPPALPPLSPHGGGRAGCGVFLGLWHGGGCIMPPPRDPHFPKVPRRARGIPKVRADELAQLLYRNVQRFRGGLVFKAHRANHRLERPPPPHARHRTEQRAQGRGSALASVKSL